MAKPPLSRSVTREARGQKKKRSSALKHFPFGRLNTFTASRFKWLHLLLNLTWPVLYYVLHSIIMAYDESVFIHLFKPSFK